MPTQYQKVYGNPSRDTLVLHYQVHHDRFLIPKTWWLRDLSKMNPGVFSAIKVLEINGWYVLRMLSWQDIFLRGYNMLDEFSGLDQVRLILDYRFDSSSRFRRRCHRRGIGENGPLFDDDDEWVSENFKGLFKKAKAKNPSIKVPDVAICNCKNRLLRPFGKSFFQIMEDWMIAQGCPLIQRFMDGDFAAVA